MNVDILRDMLAPVVGGLGLFLLGLRCLSDGLRNLAVTRMRVVGERLIGIPVMGVLAGMLLTGITQSSTVMTVVVVGLVDAGVIALRPAITLIMGANIGMFPLLGFVPPLGPLALLFAGVFALIHVFSRSEAWVSVSRAAMGFSLVPYGLNLLVGGLRPARKLPELVEALSSLNADSFAGLAVCVLTAALITVLIQSYTAALGMVMGLGASGVLDWQTAVAFSLGANLGATLTTCIAALVLSRNAKRAACADVVFNLVGVAILLPLFQTSLWLLAAGMGYFFGLDPDVAVIVEGRETFPLTPPVIIFCSMAFNVVTTLLLLPFIGVFETCLRRIGRSDVAQIDDQDRPGVPMPGRVAGTHVRGPAGRRAPAKLVPGAQAVEPLAPPARSGAGLRRSAAREAEMDGAGPDFRAGCAYVRGAYVPIAEAMVPVLDWGFTRSDATYDVVHVKDGAFFRLPDHLARFAASMAALRLAPPGVEDLPSILTGCVALSGLRDAYVAMVATRGRPQVAGSRRPADCANTLIAYAVPWIDVIPPEVQARGAHLFIATTPRIASASIDPRVKNYQWGDLTRGLFEAHDAGFDTAVLLDAEGFVTEGPGFNVFVVRDGRVLTPDRGVLEGITRASVLELCAREGIEAAIAPLRRADLLEADEVFCATTAGGVMPVARVDGHVMGNDRPGVLSARLKLAYWDAHRAGWHATPVDYAALPVA